MKVRAIIQARMSSTRLPGKSLMDIHGATLLERIIKRIKQIDFITEVIVATTTLSVDDVLENECHKFDVGVFRGDPTNVLVRFQNASRDMKKNDIIIRFTADNPLYNFKITKKAFEIHKNLNNDYTCINDLSHVVPEFIRVSSLHSIDAEICTLFETEHVTPYFRNNKEFFKTSILPSNFEGLNNSLSRLLTIDTQDDYNRLIILSQNYPIFEETNIDKIYNWVENLNKISTLN